MTVVIEPQVPTNSETAVTLKKVLPSGMVFPFDFGYIEGTKDENGHPLCVLILSEFASSDALECRLIGGIQAFEREGRNRKIRKDRLIAISNYSRIFSGYQGMIDLPAEIITEIESFLVDQAASEGKIFTVEGRISAVMGMKQVEKATKANMQKEATGVN